MENVKTEIVSYVVKTYEVSRERYLEIKEELKKEALELRKLKLDFKDCQRGIHKGPRVSESDVYRAKYNWRYKHIAYCILKGKSYEEIENAKGSQANKLTIEQFKKRLINA